MPIIERFIASSGAEVAVWRIEEDIEFLRQRLSFASEPPYKRKEHLLEYLAVRVLFVELGFNDKALTHHANGHPIFPSRYVSLTHCFPLVAVAVSAKFVGVDIQKPVQKLERIMSRYMNDKEVELSEGNSGLPLWLWAAKEAVFKKYPLKHLAFREQIRLENMQGNSLRFTVGNTRFNEVVEIRMVYGQVLAIT